MVSIFKISHTILLIISTIVAAIMATIMILIRLRMSEQPTSVKKIIIPPLMMSTGGLMFLFPVFHISWIQVLEAFSVGVICSVFLIKTTQFKVSNHNIYLIPSKAFVFILFGLLAVRIIGKLTIGQSVSFGETSGMFFLLAFGMIITWRIAMLYQFLQLSKKIKKRSTTS